MELKQKMLLEILSKKRKIGDIADILSVSRQSVSKGLAQYRLLGMEGITPKKPGPKPIPFGTHFQSSISYTSYTNGSGTRIFQESTEIPRKKLHNLMKVLLTWDVQSNPERKTPILRKTISLSYANTLGK